MSSLAASSCLLLLTYQVAAPTRPLPLLHTAACQLKAAIHAAVVAAALAADVHDAVTTAALAGGGVGVEAAGDGCCSFLHEAGGVWYGVQPRQVLNKRFWTLD